MNGVGSGSICEAAAAPVVRRIEMLGNEACDLRARLISESDPGKRIKI
ncbi:MAG: hypothetical protein LBI34_00465 [Puniceicoccales bacterium]|nr:hypothetical protein [Puniceicoccales bacterium]